MKTILALLSGLGVLGGGLAFMSGEAFAAGACLGAALTCGIGYAVLDRLDNIVAGAETVEQVRQLLVEVRERLPAPAPVPSVRALADFDAAKAVAAMEEARRLSRGSPANTASKLPATEP